MGNFFSDLFSSPKQNQTTQNNYTQLPDYPEASAARNTWGDTLKNWSTQPGYGAIQPDWNSIWQNAAGKVNRYFNGGPEGPGLIAGVKSNLAARGMSENPAAETQIGNLGMQQGLQLGDMATTQAEQQAALSEQGRTTWLNSIMQLAGLKPTSVPSGSTTTSQTTGGQGWDLLGGFGSFGVQAYGDNQQNQMLEKLLKQDGGGSIGAADPSSGGFDMSSLSYLLPYLSMAA